MRAVDVGVGHDNNAMVAELAQVHVLAEAGAECGDERSQLFVGEHLLQPRLFDVEDLALERQDRLESPVAPLLGGAAGGVTLDDVELTVLRVTVGAVSQLAGEAGAVEQPLARDQVARLASGVAGAGGHDALFDDAAAFGGVLRQVDAQLLTHDGLHLSLDLRVAQAGLRLALELRLGQLDADHRHQPFSYILAREVGVAVFEDLLFASLFVQDASQGGAEAGEVAATVDGVDAISERICALRKACVVLNGALDDGVVRLLLDVDRAGVHDFAVFVEVADEAGDAAFEAEINLAVVALVDEVDPDTLGQVRRFAEVLDQRLIVIVERLEDLRIGQKADDRAGLAECLAVLVGVERLLHGAHGRCRVAALVLLPVNLAAAVHLHPHLLREGVDDGGANAVQPARDFVHLPAELTAGVEVGHHRLQR